MKVTLFYGYSQYNAGDMAITLGALDLLNECEFDITVISRFNEESKYFLMSRDYLQERYPNINIIPCPFILDRDGGVVEQLVNYTKSFLTLINIRNRDFFINHISNSDVVFFNGGNLLRCGSLNDYLRLTALFKPLSESKKIGKPYYILPQSTAHINKFGNAIIKNTLEGAKLSFIREKFSYEKLSKTFPLASLRSSYDCALFIDRKIEVGERKKVVAITVRGLTVGDLRTLSDIELSIIKNRIKEIAKKALYEKYEVEFVVQTDKDLKFTHEIKNELEAETNTEYSLLHSNDPIELIDYYSTISMLVGMRLHSIILAVSQGTPCYGYFDRTWGLKNPGFMDLFNLGCEFVSEDNIPLSIDEYLKKNEGFFNSAKDIILKEKAFLKSEFLSN
ncbi:polysaccharide pyruvyl transferase family protein [Vibrio sp. F13]|uniref:polysaccharide pyruvyl transferase family protein n=1 Tax=unclassified Vibrio TaxID=2614977 RepID=UPI0010BD0C77|nr:polysaccharide pyruvyl transferase family protein [Vibrio sp. F13]TKF91875.1 polysaccharide pyruvyl transferase family protein [Vibrio sp. F13]